MKADGSTLSRQAEEEREDYFQAEHQFNVPGVVLWLAAMLNWIFDNPAIVVAIAVGIVILLLMCLRRFPARGRRNEPLEKPAACDYTSSPDFEFRIQQVDRVEFAAFVPRSISANSAFLLDIWAYLPGDYGAVENMAGSLGRNVITGRRPGVSVTRGSVLTIRVEIPRLAVEDPIDTTVWEGEPVNATYIVHVPARTRSGVYPGKAFISCDGMAIARLVFTVPVARDATPEYVDCSGQQIWPKSAFASYATQDREQVLSRVQGMSKIAPDLEVFVDVMSLRSGDRWQEKLEEHVPKKDVFFLFWSRYARRSIWVAREWRLALVARGLDYIDPVPLEDPELCPPPDELRELHFSDKYVVSIGYHRLKHRYREEVVRERVRTVCRQTE